MEANYKRKLASLIIWWCEGTKLRKDKRYKNTYISSIEVTNTDPKIIQLFISFLVNDLGISKSQLKGRLQIHQGDDQDMLKSYWSKESGIPKVQFNKTIIRETGNKIGKSKGTFTLRMYDKMVFNKLTSLLKEELEEIISGSSSVG